MEKKMQSNIFLARTALALALCSSGWSLASETTSDDVPQAAASVTEVSMVQAAPAVVSGFGVPMASGQLDGYRGGYDLVKNDMYLSGTVADNSAVNVMTGKNSITNGAFTNSSGFPMVIQN